MSNQDPQFQHVTTALSTLLRERTGYELSELDGDATFMELGFDSLFLIQLSQLIKQRLKAKVSFRQLIEEVNTIDSLIPYLADQVPASDAPATQPAPAPSPAPAVAPAAPTPAVQQPAPVPPAPVAAPIQAQIPVQVAAPIQAPLPMPASVSVPGNASGIEQIILQQNNLMAQHLAMLSGQPVAAMPMPASQAGPS